MSKIVQIIEEIKGLKVTELAELVKGIETEFNVSAAAPVAVAGAVAAAPEAAAEKNEYKIVLKEAGPNKINVIKAIRAACPELGLKEAKDLVEAAPSTVKEAAGKDDAKKIKGELEAAGAKVDLV